MAAVAASYVAVAAVYGSAVAVDAVKANETAWATLTGATSAVMGKAVAVLSGLNPDSYADMTVVASSSTAMAAVAASSTAMAAIIANSTAFNAVVSSSAAMSAVAASQTAMAAVVASQTAMTAVINSEAARTALVSSSVARKALKASSLAVEMSLVSSDGQYWNSIGTKTMRGLILYTKAGNTDNAFTITKVDSTTLASNNNARNAATSGSTGYKDWLEAFPNSSWVLSSITFYAYYRTTKIKYIPC